MNTLKNEHPLYVKTAYFMIAVIGTGYILYIGSSVILPILFSALFAILLNPIVNFLCRKRLPRVLAILLVIFISMLLIGGLVFFIITQVSLFSNMLPEFKIQLNTFLHQTIQWISEYFNISVIKLQASLNKSLDEGVSNATKIIGQTIMSISSALIIIFIIPVYIFMLLYYKPLLLEFINKLCTKEKHENIEGILTDSKSMVQSYLMGLMIESLIVSTLNTIGLLIIGVEFAMLLGIVSGLLNIIPYIGGVVAVLLPMVVALATQSASAAGWVLLLYVVVQFFDNYYIMPYVVASKVKINALASIVAVLSGAAIWGVPGMFLSIPLIAIIKVILDRVDRLKPYGFLLGDTIPTIQNNFFKKLNRLKSK